MSELSIAAPAKGDPITAAWAQAVTDAANGGQTTPQKPGEARFPGGYVPSVDPERATDAPPPLPRPFELRLVPVAPALPADPTVTHIYCYIPAPTAACPWVWYGGVPCVPDGLAGWTDLGVVPLDGAPHYVGVYLSGKLNENYLFSVALQTSYRVPPAGTVQGAPFFPIGEICLPASIPSVETPLSSDDGAYGLIQYATGCVHIPGGPPRPLEVRGIWQLDSGVETMHAYVCVTHADEGYNVNGRIVNIADSTGTAVTGDWLDLGAMGSFTALWLLFYADPASVSVEAVTNPSGGVQARLVTGGFGAARPSPLIGSARDNPPVLVWYNSRGLLQTVGCGVQCIIGGEVVTVQCPDSDAYDPADNKAFRSIGYRPGGATELYLFSTASGTAMTDTIADNAAMVARVPNGTKYDVKYLNLSDVACVSSTGLRWGGALWLPQSVTYKDGNGTNQTITVLVKQ